MILDSGNVLDKVIKQNITSASFFIQKAEIELITQNEKKNFWEVLNLNILINFL